MVAALFTAITLSMLDVIIHATPNLHAQTLSNDCCFCLQMKTSVFCNLYRYFLSDYFAAAAEMSFPPIPSNLVHKGASAKWAKISPKETNKTSQELRMLSSVTINCQITKIVMNSGSQLSEL